MATVEVLKARASRSDYVLDAMAEAAYAAGDKVKITKSYQGKSDWLILWGIGAGVNNIARNRQRAGGRKTLLWDMGYFGRKTHNRCSIDHDHPQALLDRTIVGPERWDSLGVDLVDTFNQDGKIVLVGLGRKSRRYLQASSWEVDQLKRLQKRFPKSRIVFRPKKNDLTKLPCETDGESTIEEVVKGSSLIVCHHSNVAVDGIIQNIPFEAKDGAATWLQDLKDRKEFLNRLAWWQWSPTEAGQAWKFLKQV